MIEGDPECRDCGYEKKVHPTDECEHYEEDFRLFTYCVSPLGEDCDEFGYVMLSELSSVKNRFGLGIERDLHWKPGPIPELTGGAR